jgi:iron complex outermembrane recepter protein
MIMTIRISGLMAGLSLISLSIASSAFAQDTAAAPEQAGGIEEIIVTAQKRAENLQDVPISIAAVTGAAVEDLRATNLQGLGNAVPNVQINTFSNTPNNAVFTIRGIGVIEPDPYAGNTVGVVVDGVPQYFSMGALLDLFDIDRVEILRGPQGTLFGANTTGGVVSVVTKQPTDKFEGKFSAGYGNYNHLNLQGVINTPLGEGLAARFGVSHDQRKGWVTNVVDGSDMGKRNVTIFRGALKYDSGDFDATLQGEYGRARNGSPVVVAGDLPGEAEFVPAGWRNMYVSPCLPAGSRCKAPDKYFSANDGVPDQSDIDTYRANLTINWRNTGIGDITSITGYKYAKQLEFTDQDGTPAELIDTRRPSSQWQFSQELRTDIKINDAINLLLGGFYMKDHYKHRQDLRINFAPLGPIGVTYDIPSGTYVRPLPGVFQVNRQEQDNWSGSLFAQTYIDVTDRLRFQAGIRYTHEKTTMDASTDNRMTQQTRDFIAFISGLSPTPATPAPLDNFDGIGTVSDALTGGLVAPGRSSTSWDNVGWKLGLDYKITDDAMLYGYWARGFKSGGYSGRIGLASDLGPYDPEKVDTFEVGMKADFLDRRVRTNLAFFYTNYRDMQLAQIYFIGTLQGNTILNAAKSKLKGFEAEVTVAPVTGLTLNGSLSYLSAKYDEFLFALPTGGTLDLKGQRLQNAPKWSFAGNATYKFPIAGEVEGRINLQYTYVSEKLLTSIIDTARASIQPMHYVNANFDVLLNENIQIGVWATNLFDNRYINSVFDSPGTLGLTNYAPPRQYGVSATYKF